MKNKKFKPRISIVIPVYNGENYLKEAIESALAQTYDNYEIIVVNDGSTDNTSSVVKEFGDKVVFVDRKENRGIAYTLNEGISIMKGDYFSWLSHDDLYFKNKLESQIDYLNELFNDGLDISKICLCGGSLNIDKNGKTIRKRRLQKKDRLKNSVSKKILQNIKSYSISGCTTLIPKKALIEAGLFDTSIKTTQDIDMWFRLMFNGYCFYYLNKRIVCSRIHGQESSFRWKNEYEAEKNAFQTWLSHKTIATQQDQNWVYFLKCSAYQRRNNYYDASKICEKYSLSICKNRFLFCVKKLVLYSVNDCISFFKSNAKKIYHLFHK